MMHVTKESAIALAEEPDLRAEMEQRGWRVTQSSWSADHCPPSSTLYRVEATKRGTTPSPVSCTGTSMAEALRAVCRVTAAIDRVVSPADGLAELRDSMAKTIAGIIEDPRAASLKLVAWAFGIAQRGSANEEALRVILIAKATESVLRG